ncbi:MAG: hypothetical protein GC168_10715 [Candidatus Hydrogenedens sp.]|nr:hypothetical protein [Candidatus Hydrogenedens sp.]
MKVKCCVCDKVRRESGWEVPVAGEMADGNVSHGYCPECADTAFREIRALRYEREACAKLAANH